MNSSDSPTTVSQSVPSTKLEQQVQQLQEEIAQLRQENEQLRQQKETEFSIEIVNQQQQTTQQQTQALEKANPELWQSDRLLEITAIAASALLTIENFDEAVKTALQTIGEGLETDRVTVIENFTLPSKELPGWRVLYEWNSPHTIAQISDLNTSQGCYEEIRDWHDLFCQGQPVSCQIEQMPEPFRSKQAAIGVKAFYIVPIFVEGRWWGLLGLDDCREAKHRTLAELAVLKIAANCIGSAIQRDRTQKAMLQAEQARSQELERLNAELKQTLDQLAESEARYRTLFELSNEGIYRFELDPPVSISLPIDEQVDLIYQNYRYAEVNNTFVSMLRLQSATDAIGKSFADFFKNLETNREGVYAAVANGYQNRNAEAEETDANGRRRYILWNTVSEVRDGYVCGGWGIQSDITELREAQQALLEAEQQRSQELERLNTELQQTLDRLSESEERYRTLFEISSEGIFRVEYDPPIPLHLPIEEQIDLYYRSLCVAEGNATYAAMYGFDDAESVVGMRLSDIDVSTSQQNQSFMRALIESRYQLRNAETEEVDRYGNPRYFLNNITTIIKDGYAIGGWASQLDITELRLAQQALLQAEQDRVAELAKANDALKQTVDALATETDLNRFLGHVLKVIAEQLDAPLTEYWYHPEPDNIAYVGLTYWQEKILKPEEQSGHVGLFGYPVSPGMIQQESLHHRRRHFITEDIASSEVHNRIAHEYGLDAGAWYQSRGVNRFLNMPLILGDRTIGALIVFLPSDRHFTEQQIELTYALAQQVTLAIQLTRLAEEAKQAAILEDRNRMAREIHDTLAQSFAGILMQLQAATLNLIDDPEQVIVHLKRASNLTREGLAEARRSVSLLLQEDAAYSDLLSSLHQLIEQMRRNTDVPISVNVEGTPYPLNPEVGMHLFRMVQESLNNALRHADPSMIQINLSYATQKVSLCIQDNGRGFDLEQPTNGFGLKGMQQRADLLNAKLQINSQIGMGTEVHITAPTHSS